MIFVWFVALSSVIVIFAFRHAQFLEAEAELRFEAVAVRRRSTGFFFFFDHFV